MCRAVCELIIEFVDEASVSFIGIVSKSIVQLLKVCKCPNSLATKHRSVAAKRGGPPVLACVKNRANVKLTAKSAHSVTPSQALILHRRHVVDRDQPRKLDLPLRRGTCGMTPKLCAMTKRKDGPGVVADPRAFPSGAMRRTDSLHAP